VKIVVLFVAAAVTVVPLAATASYISGDKLYRDLKAWQKIGEDGTTIKENFQANFAGGYVTGVIDTGNGVWFCTPKDLSLGKAIDFINQYLALNPAKRKASADAVIVGALREEFPCPKKP